MFAVLKKGFALTLFAAMFFGLPGLVQPAQAAVYTGVRVTTTGAGNITMAPGEVKNIAVSFQNTGDFTWKNDGAGYISLYTYGPKYRVSVFDPGNWLSPSQVKRMIEPSVKPGAVGNIKFDLRAPSTEGTYAETFKLASENYSWIDGGEFTLNITVKKPTEATTGSSNSSADEAVPVPLAELTLKSANRVKTTAGKSILFNAGFKNTGATAWKSFGLVAPDVTYASKGSFTHASWSGATITSVTQVVKPGETGYMTFMFTAPKTNGTHTAKFQLTVDGNAVDEFVEIPVEVTGGSAAAIEAEENENAEEVEEAESTANYITEPTIRVGVLIVDHETDDEVIITSYESDFELRDINGKLIDEFAAGQKVGAAYQSGKYVFDRGEGWETASAPLRLVPKTEHAVMTITNFDRRVTRGSAYADNTFRGVLELRYNDYKQRTWLINELKLEMYLRGLAETSNISPMEYQKALITAARTYAFYHWTRATKHAKEYYHVDAYLDQVYKGYGQEQRAPRITQAVEATRGRYVTYNNEIAITPYFSRSDGRTRDWSEVWYGNIPWAKSVEVPCDAGKTLWGHGVGMSASGALCMANQGMMWDEILKHFYTGIALDKRWE